MRPAWILWLCLWAAQLPASGAAAAPPPSDPGSAVFQLLTFTRDGSQHRSVYAGTAFFSHPDGTALTNAHVIRLAQEDPSRYYLLAFVERYFFGAAVTCSARLPAGAAGGVEAARDVAVVRVIQPNTPFRSLTAPGANGERAPFATAWNAPMPEFASLTMGPAPRSGDPIRIIGYGGSRTVPQRRVAIGAVRDVWNARDGTPVFSMNFIDPVLEGDSGAPILNVAGHVQGLFGWRIVNQPNVGVGITSPALQSPCRAAP